MRYIKTNAVKNNAEKTVVFELKMINNYKSYLKQFSAASINRNFRHFALLKLSFQGARKAD